MAHYRKTLSRIQKWLCWHE